MNGTQIEEERVPAGSRLPAWFKGMADGKCSGEDMTFPQLMRHALRSDLGPPTADPRKLGAAPARESPGEKGSKLQGRLRRPTPGWVRCCLWRPVRAHPVSSIAIPEASALRPQPG
jgi:hypothetical protein